MVKMANIVPLIIYLLIYIFLFSSVNLEKEKRGKGKRKVSSRELGSTKVALWVRVTKFHKLATTEAFSYLYLNR
jgi:hypothetical protein